MKTTETATVAKTATTKAAAKTAAAKSNGKEKAAAKQTAAPKAAPKAAETKEPTFRPAVTGFVADEAKKNRNLDEPARVNPKSQTAVALFILHGCKTPMSPAAIVEAFKAKRINLKWPVGMLRSMEKAGLIQKLAAENKRVVFNLTERGRITLKAIKA